MSDDDCLMSCCGHSLPSHCRSNEAGHFKRACCAGRLCELEWKWLLLYNIYMYDHAELIMVKICSSRRADYGQNLLLLVSRLDTETACDSIIARTCSHILLWQDGDFLFFLSCTIVQEIRVPQVLKGDSRDLTTKIQQRWLA